MVREVLTVCVGQCGIQMGQAIWEQYCAEHGVTEQGKIPNIPDAGKYDCIYEETQRGQYVPRNLMVDLEPNVIDDVKTSKYSAIFHPDFLLAGREDAANNFYRGHYTNGKEMIDKVNDRLRKLVDNCDNVQGFVVNHAVGGGTGSGLGALILERIAVDYRKKSKFGFHVYPSPTISNCAVEPYNALMTTHWLLDHTEVSVVLDNEAMYEICQWNLDIRTPSYDTLNRMIAKAVSSITSSLRFDGELNADLNQFQTNLVPFPRLHFLIPSMSQVASEQKKETMNNDVQSITDQCLDPQNFFVKIADFDAEEDKYMGISMQYRGNVQAKAAINAVQRAKKDKKVCFVEWIPRGFKVGLNDIPAAQIEDDELAQFERNVVMLANNTAISRVFSERITKKYDMMFSRRAFVHWFIGEGGSSGEFPEAREDLGFLEKDYLDVMSEQATDEDDEEEEEWS